RASARPWPRRGTPRRGTSCHGLGTEAEHESAQGGELHLSRAAVHADHAREEVVLAPAGELAAVVHDERRLGLEHEIEQPLFGGGEGDLADGRFRAGERASGQTANRRRGRATEGEEVK